MHAHGEQRKKNTKLQPAMHLLKNAFYPPVTKGKIWWNGFSFSDAWDVFYFEQIDIDIEIGIHIDVDSDIDMDIDTDMDIDR